MISIITCHHFRHDLAELFYLGVERLKKEFDIEVCAAITKDDKKSVAIAEKYGAKYVLTDNKPLGKKWNKAYELATKIDFCEDILILGEDNLVSSGYIDYAWNHLAYKIAFGQKRCGVVDVKSGKAKEWKYKDNQRLIGAGRFFSAPQPFVIAKPVRRVRVGSFKFDIQRQILVSSDVDMDNGRNLVNIEKIYALWDDNLNSGLDRSSEANLALLGYQPHQFDDGHIHVVDFKSDANIHKFSEFEKLPDLELDWKWFLSVEEKEYIAEKFKL